MKTKSSIVNKIKQDWGEGSQLQISLKILDYLLKNKHNNLSHITYSSLFKVVGENFKQPQILEVIQYLCGDRVHLLDINFELIDDNDLSFNIEKNQLNLARATGKLIHPETGEEIIDFERNVYIFFSPSDLIRDVSQL